MTEAVVAVPIEEKDPQLPEGLGSLPTIEEYKRVPGQERQAYLTLVGNLRKLLKSAIALIEQKRKPGIDEAFAKHRNLTQGRALALKPFQDWDAKLNVLNTSMELHERALVQAEQRRREEEARRQEEERRLEEAAALEAMGETKEAEAVIAAPVPAVPVAPVRREIAQVSGNTLRSNWKGEVTDLLALIKGIAAGHVPASFVTVNQTAINQHARATKGTVPCQGIRFYDDPTMAVSTR